MPAGDVPVGTRPPHEGMATVPLALASRVPARPPSTGPDPRPTRRRTLAGLAAAAALALVAALVPAVPAAAAAPTVALVGTLQSELGCPGGLGAGLPGHGARAGGGGARPLPRDLRRPGGHLAVQGGPERLLGRQLRCRRCGGRRRHHGPGTRWSRDLHLRRPHARGERRRARRRSVPTPRPSGCAAEPSRSTCPDDRAGWTYRLYWSPTAGLARDGDTVTGGESAPLTLSGGLSAGLRRAYPHLAAYEALHVPASVRRRLPEILTGQVAVATFDATGALQQVTGVQLPGVLDAVYPGARDRALGPVWKGSRRGSRCGRRPRSRSRSGSPRPGRPRNAPSR